jgi:ketosteroid isomerase-like protein
MNGFADRFAEDAVLEFPFAPEGSMPARVEGRESIRTTAVAISRRMQSAGRRLRAIDNVVVHETTDPEVVVVEFDALGESTITDSSYKMPDIQVWRVRNGEVVSMRDYMGAQSHLPRPAPAKRVPGSTWA